MKILVTEQIAADGIEFLGQHTTVDIKTNLSPQQLLSIIGDYDALIVRSQTKVTAEVIHTGRRLQVIGRAGVGVDNIDVDVATQRGIVVVNSPEGNVVSTAEHTLALLLTLARNIPQAHDQLHSGLWDRSHKGVQLRNKVLGIIGLGRVGTEVAEMARGLHMSVMAYDPMVTENRAQRLGVAMASLDDLMRNADFITIHVPLNASTRGLISETQLRLMKPTAMVINCARGGIIDETALFHALETGIIAAAAVDVFSEEPAGGNILLQSDKVITTPHLAASTVEAERITGVDIAEQVIAVLRGYPAKSAVNIPTIPPEVISLIEPYLRVGTTIGRIAAQLMATQLLSLTIRYEGEMAGEDTAPIKIAILASLLERLTDERVNMINAGDIARDRGIEVTEQKITTSENYANLITVTLETKAGATLVAGASIRGEPHLIRVNDFWLEIVPQGSYMLFTEHQDRPGMIGAVGSIIGEANINISQMQVSRGVQRGGKAMMVLCLDDPISEECQQRLSAIPDMHQALVVKL